ncbi:hypothetical protein LUZ63_008977 [Rhynchospora breviuscula]|uniref:Terpene synthase N-terminal domain-containing protein n=1 Tax=Rhynchospora breviuscula TaxID=2022672 RepID=A0A9Q0HN87_9POAL|nr:hypothetical protein LUZ63_008977 [Rhynchospora breviuscula]
MQSYMFNNQQCPKTGPSRFQYILRVPRSPTIVHAKPWTSCHNKLSVSCTALTSWTTDDHLNTIGPSSGDYVLPSVWGDYFATYTPPDQEPKEWMERRIIELKEEVKTMLDSTTNIAELVNIVDTIQRLGISYHFVNEIDDALSQLHDIKFDNEDLQNVSLRFRLLRQHGFNASSDVFCKFIDSDGNFHEDLSKDAKGLLSLYNTGYLAFPGETILDKAISFARGHLKSMVYNLDSPLKREVLRALKTPLHRMVPRIEAMFFIEEYTEKETRNDTLLKLAKMDYNLVQRLHLEELKELTL